MGAGHSEQLADWRVRLWTRGGGVLFCFLFAALLFLSSRTFISPERPAAGVEVLTEMHPPPPESRPQSPIAQRATPGAPDAPPTPTPTQPSVDAQMLSNMLGCANPRIAARRPDCPREPRPEDWRRPQLPTGGDFEPEEPVDLDRAFTRAEQRTIVMPPCPPSGCIRIGPPPPPPSRSAEQVCEEGGLGGPCRPPPFRPENETNSSP